MSTPGQRLAMYGTSIDSLSYSDDGYPTEPVHDAVGKAHDGAAPTSLAEQLDQLSALCLVVCPQPMQHSLPVRGLLEEGGSASLPGHQAGDEEIPCHQFKL